MKPGESRVTVWGQIGGLKKALDGEAVKVTCRFKKLRGQFGGLCDDELEPIECILEVDSFVGTLTINRPQEERLDALEKRIKTIEGKMNS